jgi:hypothetical protein
VHQNVIPVISNMMFTNPQEAKQDDRQRQNEQPQDGTDNNLLEDRKKNE